MNEDDLKLPVDKYLLKRMLELEEKVELLEDRIDTQAKYILKLNSENQLHHGVYR